MSKTKLAILVFCIAFGINGLAFFLSHKTFMVEESKNVWLYEIPLTASPVDAYVALDIGPHQGVIGTLFRPNHAEGEHPLQNILADTWTWDNKTHVLNVKLKQNITYGNKEPILADQFVKSHEYLASKLVGFGDDTFLGELRNSTWTATADGLAITLQKLPADFDLESFLNEALTNPMSGVIHPKNLESLKKGEKVTKDWITSGPYIVVKWTPKEIELISRSDFPVGMQKDYIRTVKYQSAPVKNPSCDFLQGRVGDERTMSEHRVIQTQSRVSILWACRSYEDQAFCKDPANRKALVTVLSGGPIESSEVLKGKTLRYRIPFGSDEFRKSIRDKITHVMEVSGGKAEETSYFFKASKDTDLELEFVVAPDVDEAANFAMALARLSTRFGGNALQEPDLVGIIESFPLELLMKNMKGESYSKVFLEPDVDEKKLPL